MADETDLSTPEDDAIIAKISMRHFDEIRSEIPKELLAKLSPEEQYLFGTISQIKVQNRWLAENQVRQNRILRMVVRKQTAQETWRIIFSTKWGLLACVLGIALTIGLTEICRLAFNHFFGEK